ncbi:MAG: hypothetical protein M1829_005119 [Trizodia sp. TS-e1964]|nr:MAG: hypothetical protein M1829_005119 [Trizodia sp. TS-e1964]
MPARQSSSRHHSHSISLGSINSSHRVSRRKSMSSSAASNIAAMAAAVKEMGETPFAMPVIPDHRAAASSKGNFDGNAGTDITSMGLGNYPSPPGSLPGNADGPNFQVNLDRDHGMTDESAVAEESYLSNTDQENLASKAKIRRASEGSHLIKGDGKRGASSDLKWEHTPEWSFTSKLLISKHQQVQLLEAASVLVAMNQDATTPPHSAKDIGSDNSSASPEASGSSELRDDTSSAETTPPPQAEANSSTPSKSRTSRSGSRSVKSKRYSSNSSAFSRSYQSAPSSSVLAGSAPSVSSQFGQYGQFSTDFRPATAVADVDEASLAAAVGMLSCSFGTPRTGPVILPPDVPPVPPLPARWSNAFMHQVSFASVQKETSSYKDVHESHTPQDSDIKMEESEESLVDEEEFDPSFSHRGRSDEEDDGVFGRMEE